MSNTSHATLDPGIIAFPIKPQLEGSGHGSVETPVHEVVLAPGTRPAGRRNRNQPVPHAARDHVTKSLCDGHGTSQKSKDETVETTCPWPSLVFLQEFFVERHAHQRSRFLNEDEVAPETQRDHEFMASRLLLG